MTGLISDTELAALRATAEASLDTPITINHITRTATAGGQDETPTLLASCNARFATPTAPQLALIADRIGAQQAWLVSIPTSATLPSTGDTVTETSSGAVFTVHAVLDPQSYNTLNRLLVGALR